MHIASNQFQSYEHILSLFQNDNYHFDVTGIRFADMNKWTFDHEVISHDSGKFFKIEGIRVKTNCGPIKEWDQPIINQHEIGILGIITKVFKNIRYYLMQTKMEPGCVNTMQLSPTVQATKSNFSQVHNGKLPAYLEYFIDDSKRVILIDQLQSEQGGRFLRKRNRNMVIEVKGDITILPNFYWLTLSEIKKLMRNDNFVNMDTRSVISLIHNLTPGFVDSFPYNSNKQILSWYINQKVNNELEIEKIPLYKMRDWQITDYDIHSKSGDYFSVIAVDVKADREVSSWSQPMIKDLNVGLIGFIVQPINGIKHFLVQTKTMPGNIDIVDLSPTVACSNYLTHKSPFIKYFLNTEYKVHLDVLQSEEGGRFFHFQNRNMIVEVPENEKIELPTEYMWITYNQIMDFMPRGMFNIESRSLISAIK